MKLCIPEVKSFFRSVPSRYMPVVRFQGCTGFVKRIVEIKIEMVRLQTGDEKNRWNGAGKFFKGAEYILRLKRYAFAESLSSIRAADLALRLFCRRPGPRDEKHAARSPG
ncbi:MAG: hypothetical protein M0P57_10175 [Syntrophales bacterium]|nr:hypothetical protein [Syntrophales bacterium]